MAASGVELRSPHNIAHARRFPVDRLFLSSLLFVPLFFYLHFYLAFYIFLSLLYFLLFSVFLVSFSLFFIILFVYFIPASFLCHSVSPKNGSRTLCMEKRKKNQ